jgi:hypothetical protein
MTPLYLRFKAAKTSEQPVSPFAIASKHFINSTDIPSVPRTGRPGRVMQMETESGWLHCSRPTYYWHFAKAGAEPLEVHFSIPSGKYFLIADINGTCYLEVDQVKKLISSENQPNKMVWTPHQVDFGSIEVKNDLFSAVLSPHPDQPWVAIRHFGFIPDAEGELEDLDYRKRLERLKALGYVK